PALTGPRTRAVPVAVAGAPAVPGPRTPAPRHGAALRRCRHPGEMIRSPGPRPELPRQPREPRRVRPPHGICVLAALILSCALAAGCGTSGPGTASASTPSGPRAASASASSPSPSPSATSPEAVCVKLVTHWAHEVLAGTAYGDYQSMGLSN